MKKNIYAFIIAFFSYIFIDVAYNLAIGLKIDHYFLEKANILDIYYEQPKHLYLLLVFFILIAIANVELVVKNAVAKKSIAIALKHGFLLGATAYATLALPLAWSIKSYPLELPVVHIITGGIFSLFTSGFTTWVILRSTKK